MRKVALVPSYNDLKVAEYQIQKLLEIPGTEVVVYEKDDSMAAGDVEKTTVGYRIPNRGRSCAAFLQYVCDHYDNLADVVCITKTHAYAMAIDPFNSILHSHKFEHMEFWNTLRLFVWVRPHIFEKFHKSWLAMPGVHGIGDSSCIQTLHHGPEALGLTEYMDEITLASPLPREAYLVCSRPWEVDGTDWSGNPHMCAVRMREIWPDWEPPDVYIGRQEHCWSIKKEWILKHPKELYQEMYNIENQDETGNLWGLTHDGWCRFWPLFWNETISRHQV